nr:glycosyltransferase family 4 protein [Paenibacillus phytohabitans]
MFLLNHYFIRKTSHAIYVSEQFLQKRYPTQGLQSSCSDVNIEELTHDILENRISKIEKIDKDIINFGLIGSLNVNYKGHETAIKALASIKDIIPPFRLRFLGGGDKARWEQMAIELDLFNMIDFCGTLPNGNPVLQWMDDTDIYLIPSLQEGLPRALVEAMSRACPALGARTGGIPELLPKEFLHKPKDWRKLAADILSIVNDKGRLVELASLNFHKSKEFERDTLLERKMKFWSTFKSYVDNSKRS